MGLLLLGATVRRSRAAPGAYVPPITGFHEVAWFWDAASGATSYVLKVGTTSMQTTSDTYDANVGNVLTHYLSLQSGTYYGRAVIVGGPHNGELTAGGERAVTV
jgi:hypothetical protein